MAYDIQFDMLERVRRAGVTGKVDVYLSTRDATRLVDGLPILNRDLNGPESIDIYEGTEDDHAHVHWRHDPDLRPGVARVEFEDGGSRNIPM